MATQSRILVWRTPWTEEPGGLQSMVSKELEGLSTQHTPMKQAPQQRVTETSGFPA